MALEGKTWLRRMADKKEAEAAAAHTEGEEHIENGPTIQEILHDPDDSKAFGQMLETKNDPSLTEFGARMRSGKLDDADIKLAAKYRAEYLDTKDRAEKLNDMIDKRFDALRQASPDIDTLCKTFGQDNYVAVLKQGLSELAMRDPAEFKKIERKYAKLADAEAELDSPTNDINQKIRVFLADNPQISEAQFEQLMSEPDQAKRTQKIREELQGQMGFLRRWADQRNFRKGRLSSFDFARNVSRTVEEGAQLDVDRAKLLKSSGNAIAALVSKNPELRNALMTARPGEAPKIENGIDTNMSFSDAKSQTIKLGKIHKDWIDYLNSHGLYDAFEHGAPDVQDSMRETYWKRYTKEQARGRGFWASVMSFVFENLINTNAQVRAQLDIDH